MSQANRWCSFSDDCHGLRVHSNATTTQANNTNHVRCYDHIEKEATKSDSIKTKLGREIDDPRGAGQPLLQSPGCQKARGMGQRQCLRLGAWDPVAFLFAWSIRGHRFDDKFDHIPPEPTTEEVDEAFAELVAAGLTA